MMACVAGQVDNEERETTRRSGQRVGWDGLEEGPECSTEELRGRQGSITDSLQVPLFSLNPLSHP